MIMHERSRVTLDADGKEVMRCRTLVSKQGQVYTEVSCSEGFPAWNTAILLLFATADVLEGSGVGQVVMAAISACKEQLQRIAEIEGGLSTVQSKEIPF